MDDQLLPRTSGTKSQRSVTATTYDQVTTAQTALGDVVVVVQGGFIPALRAGLIKVAVTYGDEPITTFALPVLAHSPIDFVPHVGQARDDFIDDDLESILAQWALDELRNAPTVLSVMVTEPRQGQAQYELNVARSIPCEPTRWNNNRTAERVNESYSADSLLEVVAKAYGAIVKPQPVEQTAA